MRKLLPILALLLFACDDEQVQPRTDDCEFDIAGVWDRYDCVINIDGLLDCSEVLKDSIVIVSNDGEYFKAHSYETRISTYPGTPYVYERNAENHSDLDCTWLDFRGRLNQVEIQDDGSWVRYYYGDLTYYTIYTAR